MSKKQLAKLLREKKILEAKIKKFKKIIFEKNKKLIRLETINPFQIGRAHV